MKNLRASCLILLPLFIFLAAGCTQSGEELQKITEKLDALQEGQKSIQTDLAEMKKNFQAKPAPKSRKPVENVNAMIDVDKDPYKGKESAMIALLDFSDYE